MLCFPPLLLPCFEKHWPYSGRRNRGRGWTDGAGTNARSRMWTQSTGAAPGDWPLGTRLRSEADRERQRWPWRPSGWESGKMGIALKRLSLNPHGFASEACLSLLCSIWFPWMQCFLEPSSSQRLERATGTDRWGAGPLQLCPWRHSEGPLPSGQRWRCLLLLLLLLPCWLLAKEQLSCPSTDTCRLGGSQQDPQPTTHNPSAPLHPRKDPLPSMPCWWMFPTHDYLNLGVYFVTIFWITLALTLLYYKHLCNHASRLI